MSKKKAELTPEIITNKKIPKSAKKSDIIEVHSAKASLIDEDELIDQLAPF